MRLRLKPEAFVFLSSSSSNAYTAALDMDASVRAGPIRHASVRVRHTSRNVHASNHGLRDHDPANVVRDHDPEPSRFG